MRKWLIICLISFVALAIIILGVVIYINRNNISNSKTQVERELANKIQENIENSNIEIVSTASMEEKTSPNALIEFRTYYKKCEHEKIESIDIPKELVNITKDELAKIYKEWEMIDFTTNHIIFRKEDNGICNEHYILKENNGYIAIYTVDEFENETLKEMTGVLTSYLPEADLIELKEGIKVFGKDKLNSRLEDYE